MKDRQSTINFTATHKKVAYLAGLTVAACYMTGCATMSGMTPSQCQQSNWQTIGYQDGLMGRSKDYVERHVGQCAKANSVPNRGLWEQGRQEGIKRYCTPLRAYQLGREGYQYNDVCPTEITLELLKAHDEGYLNYQREQTLNQLWYDNDPFFGPFGRFGGWMRAPMPYARPLPSYHSNDYPKYIDSKYYTPATPKPNNIVTPTNDVKTTPKN